MTTPAPPAKAPPKTTVARFIPAALVGGLAIWEALLIIPLDYGLLAALHQKGIAPLLAVTGVAVVLALLLLTMLAGLFLPVRPQFSLRVFLAFVVLTALPASWFARALAQANREHNAKEAAVAQGFSFEYDPADESPVVELVPPWVRQRFGPEFFQKFERLHVRYRWWRGDSLGRLVPPDGSTPVNLDWVADFGDLKELRISDSFCVDLSLSAGAFAALAKAPKITKLTIHQCRFSSNPIDLGELKNLVEVTFHNCRVDDESTFQLRCVQKLKRLEIKVYPYEQYLAQTIDLNGIADVENLVLSGLKITPENAAKLAAWPSLRSLRIEDCIGAVEKIDLTQLASLEEMQLVTNNTDVPLITQPAHCALRH